MSWLDDFFGSRLSQEPGNSSEESDADQRMREHDQAIAQLRADRKLRQVLASQEAERASAPFDPLAPISADRLWTGIHPTPLAPLSYVDAPGPPNDPGLNPSDDWQKRGRDTAAMALSSLYPQYGAPPVAGTQPRNPSDTLQPIPSEQLWAGVRPTPLAGFSAQQVSGNTPIAMVSPVQSSGAQQNWVNPTGGNVRGCDPKWGCGDFGARRTGINGTYPHEGADYTAQPGQSVGSVVDGTVSRLGYPYGDSKYYRYVEITSPNGEVVKHMYVGPGVSVGAKVKAGDVIGTAQSLQPRYPGITDHVHIEIRKNNQLVNPESIIPK